ncbi:unnamed protein product [Cercospora beticola]|nr:unnamed protein product [Cercospora beticola]
MPYTILNVIGAPSSRERVLLRNYLASRASTSLLDTLYDYSSLYLYTYSYSRNNN